MGSTDFYIAPTTDWLTVTTPRDTSDFVTASLRSTLSQVTGVTASFGGWDFPNGGCVRVQGRHRVSVISASGRALSMLRAVGVFGAFLRSLSEEVHNVTRLDVAIDFAEHDTPGVLDALYARGRSNDVQLTRKACPVRRFSSPGLDGRDTGTVYFGGRGDTRVSARVYDKRHEQLQRGLADPGPWLRYELEVSRLATPTLRDAWEPGPIFYHFMSHDPGALLPRPPTGVRQWEPGGRFELPPRPALDPIEVFDRRIQNSSELRDIILQALAVPGGVWCLKRYLRLCGVDFSGDAGMDAVTVVRH